MERKTVKIEVSVLTGRMSQREIERDLDRLMIPLRGLESGETKIDEIEIKDIR